MKTAINNNTNNNDNNNNNNTYDALKKLPARSWMVETWYKPQTPGQCHSLDMQEEYLNGGNKNFGT